MVAGRCLAGGAPLTHDTSMPSTPNMPHGSSPNSLLMRHSAIVTVLLCLLILLGGALLSWKAIAGKSATFDEPVSALGAWVDLRLKDHRIDFEHPPLWKYLAALPNGRDALKVNSADTQFKHLIENPTDKWMWTVQTLYRTPGNDGIRLVNRSRAMMLIVWFTLGVSITAGALFFGGKVAALLASLIYVLDPNFLAHGPLVKNDVAISLLILLFCFALLSLWRRATFVRIILAGLILGAALATKLTGLLLIPIFLLWLILRTIRLYRHDVSHRLRLWAVTTGLFIGVGVVAYATLWASYGFRYAAVPGFQGSINRTQVLNYLALRQLMAADPAHQVTREQLAAWHPGATDRLAIFLMDHRILPEAWLDGFLFTRGTTAMGPSYLLGRASLTGWWYYYPFAMLVKTPLSTLVIMVLALGLSISFFMKQRAIKNNPRAIHPRSNKNHSTMPSMGGSKHDWLGATGAALVMPPVVLMLIAMASNLNLGIRYILPVYPFLMILSAVIVARSLKVVSWMRFVTPALVILLAVESLSAWPNYIPFFNSFAGGARGGLSLLGDSNLDWGQDLPLLAQWQKEHPDVPLYSSYFGTVPPAAYGIVSTELPGGYPYAPHGIPTTRAILAISASHLQGLEGDDATAAFYRALRDAEPMEVLGGSIYLYDTAQLPR